MKTRIAQHPVPTIRALVLLLIGVALAGCTLLGGPSPVLPLPTSAPQTPTVVVTRSVPTALPGTAVPTARPTATLVPLSAQDRTDLLDNVWNLVNTRYVYTDFRGLDWPAVREEYRPKLIAAADEQAVYTLLAEMIAKLGDRHSSFSDPQEVAQDEAMQRGELRFSGIGVLSQEIAGAVRVVYVIPDGPADHAGIRPFDIFRAVDGTPLVSNSDAPRLIRGPTGTPVTITVETPRQAPRDVTIIRNTVTFSFQARAKRWPGTNVAYVDLPTFNKDGISNEVRTQLEALAATGPLDGVIIDLRQNGGGLISELNDTLQLFINGGTVGYQTTRRGRTADTIPSGQTLAALRGKPVVVLVSNLSESASERFASAMQVRGRGTILGTTTAGNTETVYPHDLANGARLMLAEATYLNPNAESIEDKGVIPDVVVDVPWYESPPDQDPQVLAAIKHIQGK